MLFSRKRRVRSKERAKQVLIQQILIGAVLFLVLGLIGAGVWYGSRLDTLTITKIDVSDGETVSATEIRAAVEEQLTGEYIGIVPRRFAWTYPEKEVLDAIQAIPRVKHVDVDVEDGEVLHITFTEYDPAALWCTASDAENCLFIDKTGYAYAKAPSLTGGALVRYSKKDTEPKIDTQAFTEQFMEVSRTLIAATSQNLAFNIIAVTQVADDEANYQFAGGGEMKVSLTQPIEKTLHNFETIITSEDYADLAPGNFEYIDLRYGNKVFIRKNPVPQTTTAEPEEVVASSTDAVEE